MLYAICYFYQNARQFLLALVFFITEAATRDVLLKNVIKNFAKFKGKNLCLGLFFNKVAEIFKNASFTEHLQTTASVNITSCTSKLIRWGK